MGDVLVVENPQARRGGRIAAAVAEALRRTGGAVRARRVTIAGLASTTPPGGRVVAVGGDGTVNAVVHWLRACGAQVPLGIVPAGTGNNLAVGLGLPAGTTGALRLALEGERTTAVDAVEYRAAGGPERIFVQSAALGFPADVAARYDRLRRWRTFRLVAAPFGTRIYRLLAALGLLREVVEERRGHPPLTVRCVLGEGTGAEVLEEALLALCFGNERSIGGDFVPCPRARPDDGRLDLCLVRARTGRSLPGLLRRAAQGTHLELEDAVVYRQTAGPVEVVLSEPRPFLADGDLWETSDRYRLRVLPDAFRVIVPAAPGTGPRAG